MRRQIDRSLYFGIDDIAVNSIISGVHDRLESAHQDREYTEPLHHVHFRMNADVFDRLKSTNSINLSNRQSLTLRRR
jgi:hypothetical protein